MPDSTKRNVLVSISGTDAFGAADAAEKAHEAAVGMSQPCGKRGAAKKLLRGADTRFPPSKLRLQTTMTQACARRWQRDRGPPDELESPCQDSEFA